MVPRFETRPDPARPSARREDDQRPAPDPDPVELATKLVMLPGEVMWSMFGSAVGRQLAALATMNRSIRSDRSTGPGRSAH
jgi:hypothetical protein